MTSLRTRLQVSEQTCSINKETTNFRDKTDLLTEVQNQINGVSSGDAITTGSADVKTNVSFSTNGLQQLIQEINYNLGNVDNSQWSKQSGFEKLNSNWGWSKSVTKSASLAMVAVCIKLCEDLKSNLMYSDTMGELNTKNLAILLKTFFPLITSAQCDQVIAYANDMRFATADSDSGKYAVYYPDGCNNRRIRIENKISLEDKLKIIKKALSNLSVKRLGVKNYDEWSQLVLNNKDNDLFKKAKAKFEEVLNAKTQQKKYKNDMKDPQQCLLGLNKGLHTNRGFYDNTVEMSCAKDSNGSDSGKNSITITTVMNMSPNSNTSAIRKLKLTKTSTEVERKESDNNIATADTGNFGSNSVECEKKRLLQYQARIN